MTQGYTPSNGTEGCSFIESWCGRCANDACENGSKPFDECDDGELCEILAASFRGEAEQWVLVDGEPRCTAFVPVGEATPPRCEHTVDMFAPPQRSE